MTKPEATCELWIDGARIPDAGDDLVSGTATALTGLSLSWGRDGPNEQPGPATCDFSAMDPSPTGTFLSVVHVGSKIEVWSEGFIPNPDPWGTTTYDNGSFTGVPNGPADPLTVDASTYTTQTITGETLNAAANANAPTSSGYAFPVFVPPRAFSPAGTLPNAWDDIPRAGLGETWRFSFRVKAPAGQKWLPMMRAYIEPYVNSPAVGYVFVWDDYTPPPLGTGDWQYFDGKGHFNTFGNDVTAAWIAVGVNIYAPLGMRWQGAPGDWQAAPATWNDWVHYGTSVYLDDLAAYPPATSVRRVLSFSGKVTDIHAMPMPDGQVEIKVTAADIGAELGNVVIGDNPWSAQPVTTRANRIMTLAGLATSQLRIDPPLGDYVVSYRDVDAQPAYALLQDLAQTAGGILWSATHEVTDEYLWMENATDRAAVREFNYRGNAIPAVLQATNLQSNPGLEIGTVNGWYSNSGASYPVTLSTVTPISGTYSALVTRTDQVPNSTAASLYIGQGTTVYFPVVVGQLITISFDVKCEQAGRRVACYFQWLNASGGIVTSSLSTVILNTTGPAGTVNRVSHTQVVATGAVTTRPIISVTTASGNAIVGERVWFDRMRVSTGPGTLDATNQMINPTVETGVTTGWASNNATLYPVTVDQTAPISGTTSIMATMNQASGAATASLALFGPGITNTFPIGATVSVDIKPELAGRRAQIYCNYYDAAGAFVGSSVQRSPWVALTPGIGTRVSWADPDAPPANANGFRSIVVVVTVDGSAGVIGERTWFDNAAGNTPGGVVFDGTTAPAGNYVYRWTAAPASSTSERWTVGSELTDAAAYFDGDTADTAALDYRWTGTPKNSTSQRWTQPSGAITIGGTGADVAFLSACDVLLDPVEWLQTVQDVITVVAVTWQEQTLDDAMQPAPTERTVTVQDSAAVATYGTRRLSYATELTTQADATDLANRLLAQARAVNWRMSGVTMDTRVMESQIASVPDHDRITALMDLLDGTGRMGYPVLLIDLPAYSPTGGDAGMYVEGGTYEYDGGWSLALNMSPGTAQGASATWADFTSQPSWRWIDFDPSVTWTDCYGTRVP